MRNRRRRTYIAIGMCAGAVIAIIVLVVVLSQNIQYFRTVSEAVANRHDTSQFRMAGAVVNGSVVPTADGVDFRITDGKATARVDQHGNPPQLFKDGAPVVCVGHWLANGTFDSDQILIKHGNEYTPPAVHQSPAPKQ
ncbi:MAG TPA: cytochrome c maturation protein CcmE [Acidimicrobiia bacterium]|nr:cytochrome c maturation protein CcmE [Acidimicrobiia bacterium]